MNPCLFKFLETKEYYDICVKHDFVDSCYPNKHFPSSGDVKIHEYNKDTACHANCSTGYCPCPNGSAGACPGATTNNESSNASSPTQPALAPAVTKIKLGQDVNYPPYAFIDTDGMLQGLGKDIADGMTALCEDIEIEVVQAAWKDCWDGDGPKLGAKLESGMLDACTTYTHTRGVRNDFADFSGGILNVNKAAGLLTLLRDGAPIVSGSSDLAGVTIIDVAGWAPTADTLAFVENKCTDSLYSKQFTMTSGDKNASTRIVIQPSVKYAFRLIRSYPRIGRYDILAAPDGYDL